MRNGQQKPNGANTRAEVYDWIQCIIFALVFCVLLFVFGARMVNVVGHSMVPTLEQNDKVIISNLFYHPKQGDIVVLRKQTLMDEPIVKRIIATEGQTVDIDFDDGVVYVDGKALDEPYVNAPVHDRENFEGKITVPKGSVFVMGDNRNASTDSRDARLGCVDTRYIMGRVYFYALPGQEYRSCEIIWRRILKN